ncbi:hypothetical protein IV203_018304 [Nitzschia inconspicua]|uniref:Uncharacterized protein n=1 Tax=Nitzschia inconspicua TaxID=303405 RepID=A0A9K3Q692_9STRA|nr:hypothetical protein IV203_018304 [Nitzschia inconspicua]
MIPPLGNGPTQGDPEVTGKAILCASETHHHCRLDNKADEAAAAVQALSTAPVQQTKPGLDMNMELSDGVAYNSKRSFESKYVFRMMDAILVNALRAHQAVFDVAPCLATLEEPPSLTQLRRKLHCAESIEDYSWKTSLASLAELASLKRCTFVLPNLRGDSPANAVFMQQF